MLNKEQREAGRFLIAQTGDRSFRTYCENLLSTCDALEEALWHIVAVGLDTDDDFSDQHARAEMCAAAESALGIGEKDWEERAALVGLQNTQADKRKGA